MFKLVVLCAFLAAVVAEPSAFIAPLTYSSFIAPATTTITNQASSVIHPSPNQFYSRSFYQIPYSPVAHFIKKRSVNYLNSYFAPTTYIAPAPLTTYSAPLATTFAAAPLATTYTAPVYTATAHLIKKRSAPLIVPSTYSYITHGYSAPLVTSTYTAAAPILSTPYIAPAPVTFTHFIKKRSVLPLALTTYAAPASVSHQSRVDIRHSPAAVTSYAYSAPLSYASPIAYSHVF